MPMLSSVSVPGVRPNLLFLGRSIDPQGLLWSLSVVHDRGDGTHHPRRVVALEDVPAHVDSRRPFVDGAVGHRQGLQLWQLLSSGHDNRDRARRGYAVESLVHVIGLDELSAELGADPTGEAYVLGITGQLLADRGDPHDRDPIAEAEIY